MAEKLIMSDFNLMLDIQHQIMSHIENDLRHTISVLKDLLENNHCDGVGNYLYRKGICPSCYLCAEHCQCPPESDTESESDSVSDSDMAGSAYEGDMMYVLSHTDKSS